jgi:putative alpha-1,2-mannosidase
MWRDKLLESSLKTVNSTKIEGFRRSSSWARNQVVYFVAEFSRPFRESRLTAPAARNSEFARGEFDFSTTNDSQVLIKVAISYVSIEGARKNLEAELPVGISTKSAPMRSLRGTKSFKDRSIRWYRRADDHVLHRALSHDDPAERLQ